MAFGTLFFSSSSHFGFILNIQSMNGSFLKKKKIIRCSSNWKYEFFWFHFTTHSLGTFSSQHLIGELKVANSFPAPLHWNRRVSGDQENKHRPHTESFGELSADTWYPHPSHLPFKVPPRPLPRFSHHIHRASSGLWSSVLSGRLPAGDQPAVRGPPGAQKGARGRV